MVSGSQISRDRSKRSTSVSISEIDLYLRDPSLSHGYSEINHRDAYIDLGGAFRDQHMRLIPVLISVSIDRSQRPRSKISETDSDMNLGIDL